MYSELKKSLWLYVCYFFWWALLILWVVMPCTLIVLGIAQADPPSTNLLSELFVSHAHQNVVIRFANFFFDLSLYSYIASCIILLVDSPLLLFAPLLNSVLIIRNIEQSKSLHYVVWKTVRLSTYIILIEAVIWHFRNPFMGSSWGPLIAEFIVLTLLSIFLNMMFYRYLIANHVNIQLQPIIKYLTTIEK